MTAPGSTVGTLFFLPGLGFSAALAAPLRAALGDRFRVVGIDLPGQAGAPDARDGSLAAMADAALSVIEAEADGGPWMIVAHSMGGKVAAVLAERVLGGRASVFGLAGAVLLAPSPPTPEPMDDDKRAQMLSWAENGPLTETAAREFVAQNVAAPLADARETDAVDQARRTSPLSWRRWLDEGSREDVSATVGVIDLPVVVLAGEDDADLGAAAQPELLRGVYPRARFVPLPATGHLLPYERVPEIAAEVVRLWEATVEASPALPAEWGRLIASPRTPVETRALLAQRAVADDPDYTPQALSPGQLTTLRALADRLVPQAGDRRIDLAARVDADLAAGGGDGWRPAGLPVDAAAYRLGLDAVAAAWPDAPDDQHELIRRIVEGEPIGDTAAHGTAWDSDTLQSWFEDLRTDLAKTWTSHPATLARIGFDGFATSGTDADADAQPGYQNLAAGSRDPWEPAELGQTTEEPTP
ncbi:hypothetical protein B7R54_08430 [Subtercola boreus]|uniref:AB hydrolase-1 domain-containing protein n=1 Tax=Subtercola boreus TaxID=120213 RepID=A0A3E0VIF4_9MICO|nr:alpha/beta hydrolase [Subtercola boreus]RFA09248.1 hypothetical protein B7R54_08430 [Subtercola boreus]TQL53724.1 pimeloyl-ACP methyl ester carboxylesterase [Subtercola boreus]